MVINDKKVRNITVSIILITGIIPVILYMFSFNSAPKEVIEISFRESPRYQQWIAVYLSFRGQAYLYALVALVNHFVKKNEIF